MPFSLAQLGSSPELVVHPDPTLLATTVLFLPPSLCLVSRMQSSTLSFPQDPEDRVTVPTFYTQATCLSQKQKSPLPTLGFQYTTSFSQEFD